MGDSMYNEEIKRKFLEEFDPKRSKGNGPITYLQKIAPYEETLHKDFAEMDEAEAKGAIEYAKLKEASVLRQALSVMRRYTNWCKENGVYTNIPNGVANLKSKDFDLSVVLADIVFKDENDFFTTLRSIYSFDDGVADVPYLALAWAGLRKNEIIELKDSEIDLQNRVITNHDGTIMIPYFSDMVHDALVRYVECKGAMRGHHAGVKHVIKDMSVDTFLKKMLNPGSKDFGTNYKTTAIETHIRDEYKKLSNPPRKQPGFINVWNSGRYYHLHTIEQSGVDVHAPENKELVESVFRYEKGYYDAIKMYDNYKRAFKL